MKVRASVSRSVKVSWETSLSLGQLPQEIVTEVIAVESQHVVLISLVPFH